MATQPQPESPAIDPNPAPTTSPLPEISPPSPDVDQPSPGIPAGDPGTAQPAEI
ncbi:hypothetical protein [uncultured Sphingomonas sp.]|uniref:hypothetical protein n=1 Tax=uncultured Sphingomonas sp. TaxID=158754 RepID=UPI0035CC96BC